MLPGRRVAQRRASEPPPHPPLRTCGHVTVPPPLDLTHSLVRAAQIKVHSHNDYWRDVPLFSALERGVTSIEADVWLNPKDAALYVSHRRPLYLILSFLLGPLTPFFLSRIGLDTAQVSHCVTALTRARTFRGLYVDPLVRLLEQANPRDKESGFFDQTDFFSLDNVREERRAWKGYWDSDEPITLLVDLKTRGDVTYEAVRRETEELRRRGWLTRWDGEKVVPGKYERRFVTVCGMDAGC